MQKKKQGNKYKISDLNTDRGTKNKYIMSNFITEEERSKEKIIKEE
jgi:hypothetical protein